MGSFNTVWSTLTPSRKLIVMVATLAAFGAILLLARGAATKDMALLYAGLESAAAGDVIAALDQRGVVYDVRGGSIFVPTADRDRLRMGLASDGLPANSAQGYELLDNLSGFGTTSQMFDAAYWRAKEGELARTMLASPHIRAARVHISSPSAQPFRRDQLPTAAVTVTTAQGTLAPAQADALRFLVASAVPSLSPADVAVIDGSGGLITGAESSVTPDARERVAELRSRVERLLAARVGHENAVVEVSVETVTETETISERRFDPEERVAISTELQESTSTSQDNRNGDVTVASNLPDGDGTGNAGYATNENSESRTVTNFEVSETQREVFRSPGAIKRISVAVLVNGVTSVDENGNEAVLPRPEDELADLRLLVASAVGFDAERGDEITIRSMAFMDLPMLGTEAGEQTVSALNFNVMQLIQTAVLALVVLVLGLFVVRPVLASTRAGPALLDNSGANVGFGAAGANVIEGTVTPLAGSSAADAPAGEQTDDPVERLRSLIEDRREEAIQVLQGWIDTPKTSENGK